MERLAIIDLGTNTFNLLVVEREKDTYKELAVEREGVGLGLGGINEQKIAPEAFDRGLTALARFKQICDEFGIKKVFPFGTSAIRNATNKFDFIEAVRQQVGLDIQVISGEQEAEFIYKGVAFGLTYTEPYVIMDIGGGSTEFIFADQNGIIKAKSFEIGAARIFQKYTFSDPLSNADIEDIEAYLEEHTEGFFDDVEAKMLVGASGSFETFYELITGLNYPNHKYVSPNKDHFDYFIDRILKSTQAERDLEDRIIPIRKKMAPIAAVKIRWIIRKLVIRKVTISPNSLKEGVLYDL